MDRVTFRSLCACVDGSAVFRKKTGTLLTGALTWNRFGIRDPSVLMDAKGEPVRDESGQFTVFFNARDRIRKEGGVTCVGAARGDLRGGWVVQPEVAFTDGSYAAQGSVLRLTPDHYRLYYSPDTLCGFALASSQDGRNWQKTEGLILRPQPFGVRRMGLPFVRRVGGQWVMVFEGIADGRFHIYMAVSKDGVAWEPANHGKPIYSPEQSRWDAFGQANPSLYVGRDEADNETIFMLYNGCGSLHRWDIGVLISDLLEGPWHGAAVPVLRRGSPGEWDGGRVEGARLIETPDSPPLIVYFAVPGDDSYAGGCIAVASIESAKKAGPLSAGNAEANAAAERSYNDKLAARYFDIWDNWPIQRFTNEVEVRLLETVIPASSEVLVLGSGGGREFSPLLARNCRVTAVDISPQMLKVGREHYPDANVRWVQADLHQLPRDLTGFDAAVCLGAVFNYLRDPSLVLANVRQALSAGGCLIMTVINSQHPSEAGSRAVLTDGRIRRLYSLAELKALLESAGFEIVTARGLRFLVDLLPSDWNRKAGEPCVETRILTNILVEEGNLVDHMPAEKGKMLLIHASSRLPLAETRAHE
jgi:SAM-dependent methyltransferase/predicted GH43/DUF377 family glycosyl hydrolase